MQLWNHITASLTLSHCICNAQTTSSYEIHIVLYFKLVSHSQLSKSHVALKVQSVSLGDRSMPFTKQWPNISKTHSINIHFLRVPNMFYAFLRLFRIVQASSRPFWMFQKNVWNSQNFAKAHRQPQGVFHAPRLNSQVHARRAFDNTVLYQSNAPL